MITLQGVKTDSAHAMLLKWGGAPEKAPRFVARRSFGFTKPLSSRLDWRFFQMH
jgi:hypothetical protein